MRIGLKMVFPELDLKRFSVTGRVGNEDLWWRRTGA